MKGAGTVVNRASFKGNDDGKERDLVTRLKRQGRNCSIPGGDGLDIV